MGWKTIFGAIKRPLVGEQGTAQIVITHPDGFGWAPIASGGPQGVAFTKSPGPYNRPTLAPQAYHIVDPTVTGNPAASINVEPLVTNNSDIYGNQQF